MLSTAASALSPTVRPGSATTSRLTQDVVPSSRLRTNTSMHGPAAWLQFVQVSWSEDDRFVASDWNTTEPQSPLNEGFVLSASACASADVTLTRSVVPAARSRTKTSTLLLVSPGTRFDDEDEKTTLFPRSQTSTPPLDPLPATPVGVVLTIVPPARGRRPVTKTSR